MCFVSIKVIFSQVLYQNELGLLVLANYLNRLRNLTSCVNVGKLDRSKSAKKDI